MVSIPGVQPLLLAHTPFAMLPRRNSANVTPDHVSPQATSGSVGGRRPLSLITTQQVFRASTALTAETESPESEISPQDFPPVPPPRPTLSSHLPPGNSGLRRQSTRSGPNETFRSAIEEHGPLWPPSMPMPTIPQLSERHPPTPTRLRQFAPGGGVGGFTPVSPRRGSSRDYSTADYTYRFDSMPSPRTDSGPPHYESANISGGIHANVWPTYNKISREFDEKRLAKWNADLDVLLIFVSVAHYLTSIGLTRSAGRLVLCHRHRLPHQGPR